MMYLDYLYRDANNYKDFRQFLLQGTLTKDEVAEIRAKLDEGLYFIPENVGLPPADSLQRTYGFDENADHPWHEMVSLRPATPEETRTAELPLAEMTARDLLENFRAVEFWAQECD